NEEGLDYYRRLVAGLRDREIEPVVTLYHWDLPQPLEDAGGWPLRETAERFAEYAAIVARALGDGVARWITINEPYVVANHGYRLGGHAPGRGDAPPAAAVVAEKIEAETNRVFLDPLIAGSYPTHAVRPSLLPASELVGDGDLATISAPIDFLGVNYYRSVTVGRRAVDDELRHGEERIDGHPGVVSITSDGVARSALGWPIDAGGLYDLLV